MSEPILVSEATGSDRKRLIKVGIAAGVVLLALLVLPKVIGGGAEEDPFADFGATAPSHTPAAPETGEVVEVVEAFSSRNPFAALVSAATTGPGSSVAPPAASAPEQPAVAPEIAMPELDAFPTAPPPADEPAPAPAPAPAPEPAPEPAPTGPTRFALGEVFQDAAGQVMARVRINDVVHEVAVGRDFADRYRFVSADLGTRCATFLYGDERFELCEGEERQL